jgi:hypothetical protein
MGWGNCSPEYRGQNNELVYIESEKVLEGW